MSNRAEFPQAEIDHMHDDALVFLSSRIADTLDAETAIVAAWRYAEAMAAKRAARSAEPESGT